MYLLHSSRIAKFKVNVWISPPKKKEKIIENGNFYFWLKNLPLNEEFEEKEEKGLSMTENG